jgi:hypothetical protein
LLAKARLLLHPDERILSSRAHEHTRSAYNREVRFGNIDSRFAQLLNRLTDLRNPARYSLEPFSVAADEAEEMMAVSAEMFEATRAAAPPRATRGMGRASPSPSTNRATDVSTDAMTGADTGDGTQPGVDPPTDVRDA